MEEVEQSRKDDLFWQSVSKTADVRTKYYLGCTYLSYAYGPTPKNSTNTNHFLPSCKLPAQCLLTVMFGHNAARAQEAREVIFWGRLLGFSKTLDIFILNPFNHMFTNLMFQTAHVN